MNTNALSVATNLKSCSANRCRIHHLSVPSATPTNAPNSFPPLRCQPDQEMPHPPHPVLPVEDAPVEAGVDHQAAFREAESFPLSGIEAKITNESVLSGPDW